MTQEAIKNGTKIRFKTGVTKKRYRKGIILSHRVACFTTDEEPSNWQPYRIYKIKVKGKKTYITECADSYVETL